jgi:hypothetical protein
MAAIGASTKVHFSYLDHSAEKTRTQLHFAPVDTTGDNGTLLTAGTGTIGEMQIALNLLTKLPDAGVVISLPFDTASPALPLDATAQREVAIRWSYSDNTTGKKYRFDLPAPIDDIVPTGSDDVNMAAAEVIAFKIVFDANCKSEVGNAVTLISGRFVGRRS